MRLPPCTLAGILVVASARSGPAFAAGPRTSGAGPVLPSTDADPQAPAPEVARSPEQEAMQWLRRGNRAFKAGRFEEAEKAYAEAWARNQGYDVAGNLGAAELAQGKMLAAAQHFAFTLQRFPITGDPALREQMEKAFEQCRKSVGALRIPLDTKGARVLVDGVLAGEAPLAGEVFVEPGEHTLEATLEGYTGTPAHVRVDAGSSVSVPLALTRSSRRPAEPGATPSEGTTTRAGVEPEWVPGHRWWPGLGLGAAAVMGLAGGIAFLGLHAGKASEARALSQQIATQGSCKPGAWDYDARCPQLQDTLRADDQWHDAAVGAFLVGGGLALGTVAYFLWPALRTIPSTPQSALQVAPIAGLGTGGVLLSGRF